MHSRTQSEMSKLLWRRRRKNQRSQARGLWHVYWKTEKRQETQIEDLGPNKAVHSRLQLQISSTIPTGKLPQMHPILSHFDSLGLQTYWLCVLHEFQGAVEICGSLETKLLHGAACSLPVWILFWRPKLSLRCESQRWGHLWPTSDQWNEWILGIGRSWSPQSRYDCKCTRPGKSWLDLHKDWLRHNSNCWWSQESRNSPTTIFIWPSNWTESAKVCDCCCDTERWGCWSQLLHGLRSVLSFSECQCFRPLRRS